MTTKQTNRNEELEAEVRTVTGEGARSYADLVTLLEVPLLDVEWAVWNVAKGVGYREGDRTTFLTEPLRKPKAPLQAELPGTPVAAECWPRYDGFPVTSVAITFAGIADAGKNPELARILALNNRVRLVIEAEVMKHGHKLTSKNGVRTVAGSVTLTVLEDGIYSLGEADGDLPLRRYDLPAPIADPGIEDFEREE